MKFPFDFPKLHSKQASFEAQKIAFSPVTFQAVRIAWKRGILETLNQNKKGMPPKEIAAEVSISLYGVRIILESCLSVGVVSFKKERYFISKVGQIFLHGKMTQTNMNFVHHVTYQGLFYLEESLDAKSAQGLKHTFSEAKTIYSELNTLPEPARSSWFAFDHFYSDHSFPLILPIIFKNNPKKILDVGGNIGNFSIVVANYNDSVKITIVDMPEQLCVAKTRITQAGFDNRIDTKHIDMLDHTLALPTGYDVIWMSQFLDCFGDEDIVGILKRAAQAMGENTRLFILETYWDNQLSDEAAFCVVNTSPYFTAMANGTSRMYRLTDMLEFIKIAGLSPVENTGIVGMGHTLLEVRLPS